MTDSEANPNSPQQVVFIDSNVPDIADLLSGLAPGEVAFVLDPTSDGVQQIANILAANSLTNLSSISIVGHGASGAIDLGSTVLNDGDLSGHAGALSQIGAALAPGGDLQLYSCNTASGATGRQFIADLSSYAGGAQVAASTQDIGRTATGENWTLDALSGPAASQSGSTAAPAQVSNPFTTAAEAQFSGTLTLPTTELWIAATAGGADNLILHDDDTGAHTASNEGTLFTPVSANNPSTADGINGIDLLQLDTQDQKYFIATQDTTTTEVLEGSLSSALANPTATPTFTTLFSSSTDDVNGISLTGLAVDPTSQQVFFDDGHNFYKNSFNGNSGSVVQIGSAGSSGTDPFLDGLALDLPHHVAYFLSGGSKTTTTTTLNGQPDSGPLTQSGLRHSGDSHAKTDGAHIHYHTVFTASIYETSSLTASSTSVSISQLVDLGTSRGPIFGIGVPGLAVDTVTGTVYFTTQKVGGTTPIEGGIFAVNPTTHVVTTLFRQDGVNGPTGTLTAIQVDDATGEYYVSVIGANGVGGQIWVGSLSTPGTPTLFETLPTYNGGTTKPAPMGFSLDNAPSLSITPSNPTFTESTSNPASLNNAPVALLSAETDGDSDNTELVSAHVTVSGFFAGDTLNFSNNNNITGSYNSSTGVLTFTGEDTFAHYQSALASVQFTSKSDNPTDYGSDTTRVLSWTVNDGLLDSPAQSETVTVVGVNDPPTLSNVAAAAHFTEGGSVVVLSSGASVSDPDSLDLASATVSITAGTFANDGDKLIASPAGTVITVSYDSTNEILHLSGSDTLAHYQSVLDSVVFNNTSLNPDDYGSQTTRQVTWSLNDGSGSFNLSTTSTTTVTITAVNDPPTLTGVANASFTEKGSSVVLSPNVTVTDPDNLDLAGATVKIAGGTFSNDGDVLTATTSGTSITASYNSTSETLVLSGSDTLANYQSVLDTVTFNDTSLNPTSYGSDPTRTVTWVLNDGGSSNNLSTTQSSTISITAVNDPPTLSNVATGAQFTEGGGAAVLSSAASVSDPDNLDLAGATLSITTGTFAGDGDVLAANGVSNGSISQSAGATITISYNSSTETLTLTGSDTLAHYQTLLDQVTFRSSSDNPTDYGADPTRTVTWVLNDGSGSNNLSSSIAPTTVSLTAVNDPPTLTGTANASYTELAAAVPVSPSVTVADPDNLDLVGATVALTGGTFANDGDVLAAVPTGNITVSYDSTSETLTLTGSDTLANYQSVLDSVTFADPGNHNPTDFGADPTRTVTWTLNDGSASLATGTATSTISITAVNDPPTLANVVSGVTEAPSVAVTLSNAVSVTDPDNLDLAAATVAVTGGTFASDGDVLAAVATGNINVSFNSTSETLTLTGTDTLAHYQSVLDTVTFDNASADPTDGGVDPTRTISWVLNDGAGSNNLSTPQFTTVTLAQGPAIGPAASATWTEEGPSATLSPSIALTDTQGTILVSATVSLASGDIANGTFSPFGQLTNDQLAFSTSGTSITASYNSATETLLLTGSDTIAHYQSVLDTVAFSSAENPTNYGSDPTRIVTWTVNDGAASHNSATATSTIEVNNVNDPPTLANLTTSASFTEGAGSVFVSPSITVTDPDDLNLASATVQITGGSFANDGDVLATDTTGLNITASYNSTSETLTLIGTDTLADYQHVFNSVTFNSTSFNPTDYGSDPTRTITWTAVDPGGTAFGGSNTFTGTTTVSLTAVNNPPTLANVAASASFTEEGGAVSLSPSLTVSDPDNLDLAGATVSITSGAFTGDVLLANTSGTSIAASYNSTSETLTLTGTDTLANYQSVLDTVSFNAGENPTDFGADPSRTVTWVLNDGATSNNLSTAATTTLGVTNVNDPPTLTNVATGASFTQGGGSVVLSNAVSVSDPDNLDLVGATVSITTGTFAGDGDVLAAAPTGNITVSYNSTSETLTLSGSDTLADYQSALDTVSFNSTSLNPTDFGSVTSHQVTWVLNDGSGSSNLSAPATTMVSLTGVNEVPTLTNVATVAHFTEEGGAGTLSSSVTVTDADNLDLVSATVQVTSGGFTGDVLAAIPTGNITVSYNSTSETLTLTGTDTLANYQSVLDTVSFNAGENPTDFGADPARTVTWVLNNGGSSNNISTAATTTISVTNVNDPPTLSNVATGANFTQGAGTVVLSNAVSVSDPDNLDLASATVSIATGTFAGDGDVLAAKTAGTSISASYNSTSETLILSGADTLAHYQSVLDTVTFNSTSFNPTDYGAVFAHQVTWVLNDGAGSSNLSAPATTTVTITPVHQPPTLSSVAVSDRLRLNQTITVSPSLAVTDPDSLTLAGATVAITAGTFAGDGDVLAANTAGTSISASYNSTSETLILSGSDTLANYTSVLDSVTFSSGTNPSDSGLDPTRLLTWTVDDGAASNNTASATTTISVPVPVKNDFNGDQTSDIAFQDIASSGGGGGRGHNGGGDPQAGNAQVYLMNNATVASQAILAGPGTSWHIVGSADFNGDGNSDIVWQNNSSDTPLIWTMNGATVTSQTTLASPGAGWSAVATGDFNGDGHPDLLFQNTSTGAAEIWTMNGTSVTSMTSLAGPGSTWRVAATGDLNGDGKSDIVFQNSDGTPQVWLMNGTSVTSTASLSDPGSTWHIVAAADFNHDGEADLLFQNTSTGAPMIWTMNGTSVTSQTTLASPGTGWSLVGASNYNGNGQPELLFQNTSNGTPMIWTMNGTSVTGASTLASPGQSWHANTG